MRVKFKLFHTFNKTGFRFSSDKVPSFIAFSGDTVLVTAAAGGTGQFAVQLAKLAGCHVIGTCGSQSKADLLSRLNCDRVINYNNESVSDVLKAEYPQGEITLSCLFGYVKAARGDGCFTVHTQKLPKLNHFI